MDQHEARERGLGTARGTFNASLLIAGIIGMSVLILRIFGII